MFRPPARTAPSVWEFLILSVALTLMSLIVVRCHWMTLWMDWEFTGWVAPIANRLSQGLRLYEPQTHLPMPPLPFLVTYAVSGGDASWLTESTLIVIGQSVLVLAMYVGLARYLPRPIPLIAAFNSIPLYFALPKTIFYDALVQSLVALTAVFAAPLVAPSSAAEPQETPPHPFARRHVIGVALVAFLTALAILSKQSTGVGLAFGVALMLVFFGTVGLRERCAQSALFLALTLVWLGLLCVVISPWVNIQGMVQDVFLTGSEPKGGTRRILLNAVSYAKEILATLGLFAAYGVAFAALLRNGQTVVAPAAESESLDRWRRVAIPISVATVAGPVVLVVLMRYQMRWHGEFLLPTLDVVRPMVLGASFALTLVLSVRQLLGSVRNRDTCGATWFSAMFLVLFVTAIFHNLSCRDFRWSYDNNPLITLALAGLAYGALNVFLPPGWSATMRKTSAIALGAAVVSWVLWGAAALQVRNFVLCRDRWPEVRHLRGARMIVGAGHIRQFVAAVRDVAPNPRTDDVLLLPNDPNVEAWFERPRPKLSSAIIFTDQYWDRYVEPDFQILCASPPRVIVVGPRNYWRAFQRNWNVDKGCERLIDLVQDKLLAERYSLHTSQPIYHRGLQDFMDIYVLKDAAPVATSAQRPRPSRSR